MSNVLILAEKPSQGVRLAEAFNLEEQTETVQVPKPKGETVPHTVKVYRGSYNGDHIAVIAAKGHLLELRGRSKEIAYFGFDWKPPTTRNIDNYARLELLKQEAELADTVLIGTDFDDEGELIGYNIANYADVLDKTYRMEFQSLMPQALQEAYNSRIGIRYNVAEAAELRAWMDRVFGYIFSKMLTTAYKQVTGATYMQLSVGRVMTPTLFRVIQRMREIETAEQERREYVPREIINFSLRCPVPGYGTIYIDIPEKADDIDLETALQLREQYANAEALLESVYTVDVRDEPSASGLEIDTIRSVAKSQGIDYVRCDGILEALYLNKLITYPRSESTTMPPDPEYHRPIFTAIRELYDLPEDLFEEDRDVPRMGWKHDGAHWAIHPTGEVPSEDLPSDYQLIYDYICRDYLKGFARPLERTDYKARIRYSFLDDVEGATKSGVVTYCELIHDYGYRAVNDPSFLNYEAPEEEDFVPDMEEGIPLPCYSIIDSRMSRFDIPERVTKSDLFWYMQWQGLGTDATRASILEKLWNVNYLRGDPPFATVLGVRVIAAIEQINDQLTQPDLTRNFDRWMDAVRNGDREPDDIKNQIRDQLTSIVLENQDRLPEIGRTIAFFGECPKCSNSMQLISWRRGTESFFFLSCSNEDCEMTSAL